MILEVLFWWCDPICKSRILWIEVVTKNRLQEQEVNILSIIALTLHLVASNL